MYSSAPLTDDCGLQVRELSDSGSVNTRPIRPRDPLRDIEGMQRLAQVLSHAPSDALQQLVDLAVELCHADSAGISIVKPDGTDEQFYEWVAVSGEYHPFLRAVLPRYPSACGVTLDLGRPQQFTVDHRFFDILGVTAEPVADGLLLPWTTGAMNGTIFVISHRNPVAFDMQDCRVMQILADFAATAVRQQQQQEQLLLRRSMDAAGAMAHMLAHQINNPLQSLTNSLYLLEQSPDASTATRASEAATELQRLSGLVSGLLEVYSTSTGTAK